MTRDAAMVLFPIQDALCFAESMVIAAETLGLGGRALDGAAFAAVEIATEADLPPRVDPFVRYAVGFPTSPPTPLPRRPLSFTLQRKRVASRARKRSGRRWLPCEDGYIA